MTQVLKLAFNHATRRNHIVAVDGINIIQDYGALADELRIDKSRFLDQLTILETPAFSINATPPTVSDAIFPFIYNDSSQAAIDYNDELIADYIADLPSYPDVTNYYGGKIILGAGLVHYSETINFPTPFMQTGNPANRPLNFGIIGDGVTSRLVYHGSEDAVRMFNHEAPGHYLDYHCRWLLRDVVIQGGRYYVKGSSKFIEIDNVVVTLVPDTYNEAVKIVGFTGGRIHNLYAWWNQCDGIVLEATFALDLNELRALNNVGRGVVSRRWLVDEDGETPTGAWGMTRCSGKILTENNGGYGVDFDYVDGCDIGIQGEQNNSQNFATVNGYLSPAGGDNHVQLKFRNCQNCEFGLNYQENRSCDFDPMSRDSCKFPASPIAMNKIGVLISDSLAMGVTNGGPLIHVSGNKIIFEPGALAQGGTRQVELTSADASPYTAFAPGDRVQVDIDYSFETNLKQYISDGYFMVLQAHGDQSLDTFNLRDNMSERNVISGYMKLYSSGLRIRQYLVFLPATNNIEQLELTINSFTVHYLDNNITQASSSSSGL